jgi:DNA-binding PadR family transcriptional regulator
MKTVNAERQLLVLGLLLSGRKHGYQVNEYFRHTLSFCADLKRSTAYHVLNSLEKDGHVVQEVERAGKRPERRVYELTDKGRALFFDLLRDQLGEFSRTYYRDDVAVAFSDQLPVSEARELLGRKLEKTRGVLEQLQEAPAHEGSWRHVLTRNIWHLEAEVNWLSGVLEDSDAAS